MSNIKEKIQEELKQARVTCEISGDGSKECVEAWDHLGELEAEASAPQEEKQKNSLEVYCDDNPDAAECRLYED
ncbi:MAG: hypothetical protein AUK48_06070 [Oscillatoriales cyanobacterium CG2_30_44_21]|nr:MAG: hypothetical protein AUK48_06070 [Oscillatoriales cyanobacterium CG2_30_44_21]